jgi:type VI secretion system protein ImpK
MEPLAPAARMPGEAESLPRIGKSPLGAAAAPLLDLLGRIGADPRAGPVSNPDELRDRAVRALQTFEAECRSAQVPEEQLRAAHYALCAALDDTALATPWGQSSNWAARSLSSSFHQDVRSGERFFDLLAGLQREPGRYLPALEICYLCLSLGMRGRYRLDPRGSAEIERVREGLYQLIVQLAGPFERELSAHWKGVDAPHKGPGRAIPAWVALAVVVALLGFAWIWASRSVNDRSDALQQQLVQLPPGKLAGIARTAAPVAPAAVPSAGPDAVDKMRQLLAPEIAEGLVAVEGDPQRLLIRVTAGRMFDSGSATVEPRFIDLLRRIGEAVRTEPGRITVLGHSDNVPIRTVQFPSNFQLSAARAKSAMDILAGPGSDSARFSSAGRADAQPLASNDTPQGREKNRRIEIVLQRGAAS